MGIPERLVQIREQNGYTRKRLAEELGKPYATITKYETGQREPGHSYIIEIAKKFGVSTDYILGIEKEKAPEPESPVSEAEIDRVEGLLYNAFLDAGLIEEGQDLTPEQIDFLDGLISIIHAFFNKGQQSG